MSHFFAYISKMRWIKRWGLMKNTAEENIMEHSWQVAAVAHALAQIENDVYGGRADVDRIIKLALYHELGEVITGDLATPVKYYNPEVKTAFAQLEDVACAKILGMLPAELQDSYRPYVCIAHDDPDYVYVKAADKICAYLKCVEELKWGNREFTKAEATIKNELAKVELRAVKYFMENFVESFSLTLDELN